MIESHALPVAFRTNVCGNRSQDYLNFCSRKDGMVQRLTFYSDLARTNAVEVQEVSEKDPSPSLVAKLSMTRSLNRRTAPRTVC